MRIFGSQTSLVEIDLLRGGTPLPTPLDTPVVPPRGGNGTALESTYRILVSRAWTRPRAEVYPFGLSEPIPSFSLPLEPGDVEPEVPLNQLLHELYDRAGYDLAIDYRERPEPPFSAEQLAWVQEAGIVSGW